MRYYPLFLDLKDKKAVVAGGGSVAERKTTALIKAGADVEVISPLLTTRLTQYKENGKIKHKARRYRKGDLTGAFIVFACTSSREANIKIVNDAKLLAERPPLVNAADNPSEGSFIVPSSISRGPLTIAISTEGSSPAVAKRIRKEIEEIYDHEFAKYLKLLKSLRSEALAKISDDKKRDDILKRFSSPNIFSLLRKNGYEAVSKKLTGYIRQKKR